MLYIQYHILNRTTSQFDAYIKKIGKIGFWSLFSANNTDNFGVNYMTLFDGLYILVWLSIYSIWSKPNDLIFSKLLKSKNDIQEIWIY